MPEPPSPSDDVSGFAPGTGQWVRQLGEVRDAVRQHLVAAQLDEGLRDSRQRAARVLDVGCGQGTQALRLARQGHAVTGLDPSRSLLARFGQALAAEPPEVRDRVTLVRGEGDRAGQLAPGPYDLVLCHGVLMYLADDAPLLTAVTTVLAPGGRLSLLVRNRAALAPRPGLLGHWQDVPAAVGATTYVNRLGLPARAHAVTELDQQLAALGLRRTGWWGVRVLSDHLEGPAPVGEELEALLAAESAVSGVDPYRQVAALTHLLYER